MANRVLLFRKYSKTPFFEELMHRVNEQAREQKGHPPAPEELVYDAQSVKTICGGHKGFDGGKKVKGRKRHIAICPLGLLAGVFISTANTSDNVGGALLTNCIASTYTGFKTVRADQGYKISFIWHLTFLCGWAVRIVKKVAGEGFRIQPKRWKVERTFAWLENYRRLNCDYEKPDETSRAMVCIAAMRIALKKANL